MASPLSSSGGPIMPGNGPIMPGNGPINPADARARLSAIMAMNPAPAAPIPAPAPAVKPPDQNSPDPISWVFDMLDRPRRVIADSASAVWDGVVDGVKMWSDVGAGKTDHLGKDASNLLGDAGEAISAPFRGAFSTNAEDQQTGSQLIEKGVDKWGKTLDPHYKDTKDNVNPLLKAGLGLGADIVADPLTWFGGPVVAAALHGGKALLTGAKAAKDLGGPIGDVAAEVSKVADKAIGGDAKAADTLDTVSEGAANNAERVAQAETEAPAPVTKITEPTVTPLSTELGSRAQADALSKQIDELNTVDSSKMTPQERATFHGKLEALTTERDRLIGATTPEVSQPITAEGQAATLTGTDTPLTPAPAQWTLEQENALARATKRLDKMAPGAAADKLQAQVDAWTAEKAAAHQVPGVPPVEAAPAAPAPNKTPPVENPVIPGLKEPEPQSLGDALRASGAGKNFVKAYEGAQKLADQHKLSMLDTLTRLQQQNKLSALLGDNFLQSLSRYSNPDRFGRMLDETYRIIKAGGHLDGEDLETTLTGTRTMLNSVIKDAGLAKEKIQTARAAFQARSAVLENASLDKLLPYMKSGENATTGLVKQIKEPDLQAFVKGSLDRLREDKPGMVNPTRRGAKSTGGDTKKSFAEYRTRLNTHNQVRNLVEASKLGTARMRDFEQLGGAARSAALRDIVMGIPNKKAGLFDSLTTILDERGAAHWLDDGKRDIPIGLQQGIQILAGDPAGQRIVDKLLFNGQTQASKTNIADALVGAAHGDSREQILAALKNPAKRYREDGDNPMPNFLGEGKTEGLVNHELPTNGRPVKGGPGERMVNNYDQNGKIIGVHAYQSADSLAEQTADLIVARRADLIAQVAANHEAYAQRFGRETRELTQVFQTTVDAMRADPALIGDAVRAIAHPRPVVEAAAELAGARADSVDAAVVASEATISEPDQVVAQQIVKSADAVKKGDAPAALAATQVLSDTAAKPVSEAYEALRGEAIESGAVADTARIEEKLAPAEPPIDKPPVEEPAGGTPEDSPIGQPADPLEEVFKGARYDRKAVSAAERIVAGENEIHGRIQSRALQQITSATGVANKAANMVREGFSFEALDTAMRTQLSELANKHGGLLLALSKLDAQVTEKLRISDIVRQDAFAGRASAAEYAEQRKITDQILAHWMNAGDKTDPNAMLAEPLLRGGASPSAIIKHLKSSGVIPEELKFEQDELQQLIEGDRGKHGTFAGGLAALLEEKGVRIPDSYDFYQKMFGATATYGTHAAIAQDFIADGVKLGYVSKTFQTGMRRIVLDNDTIFAHFINRANVYADPETFGAMLRMSDLLNPKSKAAGELAHIGQIFDDVQQLWKWGEVAIRPGTRVHNYISDHIMTWLAMGAKGFRSGYAKSLKMMASNGAESAGALSQEELIQAIQRVGGNVSDRTFKGANEVLHSGQYGSYTSAQSWRLFHKAGLRTSARAIERTDKENLSGAGRLGQRVYNSKLGQWANKLTETTENQVRATHFSIALDRALKTGKVTTRWGKEVSVLGKDGKVDEDLLANTLGDSVRRYHPDPHMLTQTERNTIRRVLPFYSWNRGAVPAILDAMYMHPGRGLVLNKVSFAVGQALGVSGNNLADPFPNGMWPSFLTGQAQGPQVNIGGQMFMANPGIPTWDVANMFTDPNNISGSVSPLLAVPATLMSGKDFRTGQPITNKFDALDQQLPIIANYEGGTGNSVLGSLVGMLNGSGPQKTSAGAQQQIEQNPNQGALAWLNWGLGAQVSHVNKASYVQAGIAEQQKRLSAILSGQSPSLGANG